MRLIWIIVITLAYCSSSAELQEPPARTTLLPHHFARKWIHSVAVEWVGVLSYRKTKVSKEFITGIILIKEKLGLVNAFDVAHIPKANIGNTTKALFLLREGVVRTARVCGYVLHPEYDVHTLNTIALMHLNYDKKKLQFVLPNWPQKDEQMNQKNGNIYAIGYIDEHEALEQVVHPMELVDLGECNQFLQQEQLDKQWLTPTKYQCFRKKFTKETCLFESGMALAVYHLGKWTLLGISILGPGCVLPARFIDLADFVPWVQEQISVPYRDAQPTPRARTTQRRYDTMSRTNTTSTTWFPTVPVKQLISYAFF